MLARRGLYFRNHHSFWVHKIVNISPSTESCYTKNWVEIFQKSINTIEVARSLVEHHLYMSIFLCVCFSVPPLCPCVFVSVYNKFCLFVYPCLFAPPQVTGHPGHWGTRIPGNRDNGTKAGIGVPNYCNIYTNTHKATYYWCNFAAQKNKIVSMSQLFLD